MKAKGELKMMEIQKGVALSMALLASAWPAFATAQSGGEELMNLDKGSLKNEIQMRYDVALNRTLDPAVVSADSNVFSWASQAKAQCGIALGFLKSGTKDPVSIAKCADAYARLQTPVAVATSVPPAPELPCSRGPVMVFFDWNRADITVEASTILDNAIAGIAGCGPVTIDLVGHTDRSGRDQYNQGLSERRAGAVQAYFVSRGLDSSKVTSRGLGESNPRVPTADGVRELQNRRVEIAVN